MDAAFFDRFTDATWDLPLWAALASRHAAVLEVGCGTGRVARTLRRTGVPTFGIEQDDVLAAVARPHLDHVWVGDLLSLPVARRFPLIIVPCNTAAALPDGWLDATRRWLEPGGLLAFDVLVPEHRSWGRPPFNWERQRGDLHEGGIYDPTTRKHAGWMRWNGQHTTRTTTYPPLGAYLERLTRARLTPPVFLDAEGAPVDPEAPEVDWCLVLTRSG